MANGVPDSYLIRRNGTWHYRRRVPADVQPYEGLRWWKKSLKTSIESEAKERARVLASKHDAIIAVARGATPAARHAWLSDVAGDAAIAGQAREAHAAATQADKIRAAMVATAQKQLARLPAADRDAVAKAGGVAAFLERAERDGRDVTWQGIRLLFDRGLGRVSDREGDARQAVIQSMAPHVAKDQHTLVKLGLATPETANWEAPDNPRINTAVAKWFAERKQGPAAVKRHTVAIRRFVEMHGNVAVQDITKPMVRDYLKRIENLPDHRKLPTEQRGTLADPGADVPRIAAPTVERHLVSLQGAARVLHRARLADGERGDGSLKGPEDTRPHASKRRPFTRTELKQLLGRAVEEYGENGDMAWLVRLGAYTGARLEELAQLALSNVREIDGVSIIEIDDLDGRDVKTAGSVKQLPLHPTIKDDFLAWVGGRVRGNTSSLRSGRVAVTTSTSSRETSGA